MLIVLLLLLTTVTFADTRYNHLPEGFKWRYVMDEREPSPRLGQFWRSGILLEDRLIALNTHTLIALDLQGRELWKMGLESENAVAEAKIIQTLSNEIILVITDALLRINTDTGELIDHYGYDVNRRSAFQFTELLPRTAILYQDHIYVFLGPQLLSFHIETLQRTDVFNFNSSPKTLPVLYHDQFVIGFLNNNVEMFHPLTKQKHTLLHGRDSIRQIVIDKELIFIPSANSLKVYSNTSFFAESDQFPNNILSHVDNKIWLRQHNKGTLHQIDETLSSLKEVFFIYDRSAGKITAPLVGFDDVLLNVDGIEGIVFVIKDFELKDVIYSESFMDNPPLQLIDQRGALVILGGFDGLYLVDLADI